MDGLQAALCASAQFGQQRVKTCYLQLLADFHRIFVPESYGPRKSDLFYNIHQTRRQTDTRTLKTPTKLSNAWRPIEPKWWLGWEWWMRRYFSWCDSMVPSVLKYTYSKCWRAQCGLQWRLYSLQALVLAPTILCQLSRYCSSLQFKASSLKTERFLGT